MKKKILIVSKAFYPDISPRSFRTTELVKEFSRQGHDVTLIIPENDFDYAKFLEDFPVEIKRFEKLIFKEIKIENGSTAERLARRALRRLMGLLFDYPDIEYMFKVKSILAKEDHFDLLISVAVPHPIHWGVAWERSSKHQIAGVWVADCGDPYMGDRTDSFRKLFYFRYIEKWFCRSADYISVPVPGAISAYYPEFRGKVRVIPQGFRFEDIAKAEYRPNRDKPIFAYAGGFIKNNRDPREFCEYLLRQEKDFEFHVYTKSVDLIKPYADKSKGRIILKDYLSRLDLLHQLSKVDFVVNFENNSEGKQMPSKLIDYAILEKPILSVKTGALESYKADMFLRGDYSNRYIVNDVERYRIQNVTQKFLELINEK